MLKNYSRSITYRNFITSYILILFIPLLILVILFLSHFENLLQQEVENNIVNAFSKNIEKFETQVDQLRTISVDIQLNDTFRNSAIREKPYLAIPIRQEISNYNYPDFLEHVVLYDHINSYFYSADFLYSKVDFINFYLFNEKTKNKVLNFIESKDSEAIFYFTRDEFPFNTQNSLLYLQKLPLHMSDHSLTAIYFITHESISSLFESSIADTHSYIFISNANQYDYFYGHSTHNTNLTPIRAKLHNKNLDANKTIRFEGNIYSIFNFHSTTLNLDFVQLIPNKLLLDKKNNFRVLLLSSMLLIILLSTVLISVLMRINYKPIRNLRLLIEASANSAYGYSTICNEIEVLEYAFQKFEDENKTLQNLVKYNQSIVQAYLLDSFLLGDTTKIENIDKCCQKVNLNFHQAYYTVAILGLSNHSFKEKVSIITEIINSSNILNHKELFMKDNPYDSTVTFIFGSSSPDSHDNIKESIIYCQQKLLSFSDDPIDISIGNTVSNINHIHLSYTEAHKILNYNRSISESQLFMAHESPITNTQEIAYPFQLFELLKSSLYNKDEIKIKETINEIMHYIRIKQINLYWAKYISYDIINTILKTLLSDGKSANLPDGAYMEQVFNTQIKAFNELNSFVLSIVDQLVHCLITDPRTFELKLLQKIVVYIHENHLDQNFSLQALASSLEMSPPYISQYFKKHTQYNISEYVIRLRLEKAKNLLLEGDMSIDSIALSIGYCSTSSFIRKFKNQEGITPGQYKKRYVRK